MFQLRLASLHCSVPCFSGPPGIVRTLPQSFWAHRCFGRALTPRQWVQAWETQQWMLNRVNVAVGGWTPTGSTGLSWGG